MNGPSDGVFTAFPRIPAGCTGDCEGLGCHSCRTVRQAREGEEKMMDEAWGQLDGPQGHIQVILHLAEVPSLSSTPGGS